jgi:hypothetical protein
MGKHQLDTEIDIEDLKVKYIFSSAHRRIQKDKSRWTVTTIEELECFKSSLSLKHVEGDEIAWGYIKVSINLNDLGINKHKENLKIAKFVDKSSLKIWHGYPADFVRNAQDRPGIEILKSWRQNGIIEKHHIIKIRQGKVCNL